MPEKTKHHVVLGIDFGMRRIGIAVGQIVTQTATPLTILKATDGNPRWEDIEALIQTWNVDGLIVGIPYNMDGSEQTMTHTARRFTNKLRARFGLPTYTIDERLTTIEAKYHQLSSHHVQRKKFTTLDSYAAKIILEQWLREHSDNDG